MPHWLVPLLLSLIAGAAFSHATSAQLREHVTDDAARDAIPWLPGWGGDVGFGLYGGYVTVDEDAGRALYYVLAESADSPRAKPLVLWLNGGPGCSSLGGGFMSELGPFYPLQGGRQLQSNPYSWTLEANVVFLEAPAFVGFSYSNTSSDRRTGDARTTADNLRFLRRFFDRFPQYADRELWLAGESYAGHYVPLLAEAIQLHNLRYGRSMRLQGIMAGNPWTDPYFDNRGQIDYLVQHQLLSQETADDVLRHCAPSAMWPLPTTHDTPASGAAGATHAGALETIKAAVGDRPHAAAAGRSSGGDDDDARVTERCREAVAGAGREIGPISIYDIYEDVCTPDALRHSATFLAAATSAAAPPDVPPALALHAIAAAGARTAAARGGRGRRGRSDAAGGGRPAAATRRRRLLEDPNVDPCVDAEVEAYLNRPEVQAALHANTTGLPGAWRGCSDEVEYSLADCVASMLPVYRRLMRWGVRVMVYSGTVDAAVPVTGTRYWVDHLRLPVRKPWRAWMVEGQVGGHVVEFEGLTLAMVRDAGHMVPYTQPARALHLLRSFLRGRRL